MKSRDGSNLKCPFCGTSFYRSQMSFVSTRFYLKRLKNRLEIYPLGKNVSTSPKLKQKHPEMLRLEMAACPNCHRITVRAVGIGDQYKNKQFNIYPQFDADPLPKYVPNQIRQDYKEAIEIVNLSPKSSAMLSRRILEEVINDFYRIQEGDLYHDVEKLRNTLRDQHVWQAIDAIRRMGNISAHSTANVNSIKGNVSAKAAKQMTRLIRLLIHDTYVEQRYNKRIEKNVIKSAKHMNYVPHYYPNDNFNPGSSKRRRNSHRSSKGRRAKKNHRKRRNKRQRRYSKKNEKARKSRKNRRAKKNRRRNRKKRQNRRTRKHSTHRSKKSKVRDKSYTIIQNK